MEVAVKQAVARREEELRILVVKREEEVAVAIAKREEEIMEAVRNREAEVDAACLQREQLIKKEVDERIQWVLARESELKAEEIRLEVVKRELEESAKKVQQQSSATTTTAKGLLSCLIRVFVLTYEFEIYPVGRKEKSPLEEVKNLLEPTTRTTQVTPVQQQRRRKPEPQLASQPTPSTYHIAAMETPISRPIQMDYMPSAMKGVVLTLTGEILSTPSPAELVNLFNRSPKVGLNFGKIFDFEEGDSGEKDSSERRDDGAASPPPSPSSRKEREKTKDKDKDKDDASSENSTSSSGTSASNTRKQQAVVAAPPPTRIRRPSIRSSHRASRSQPATLPTSTSDPAGFNINGDSASTSIGHSQAKPLPHPHLRPSSSSSNLAAAATAAARSLPIPVPRSHPSPEYDFADEENLPSPFLKRVDKAAAAKAAAIAAASILSNPSNVSPTSGPNSSSKGTQSTDSGPGSSSSSKVKRRGSSGLLLRAVAAANSTRRGTPSTSSSTSIGPPNANSVGMENEGEMMTSGSSVGEVGGVDARPSLASARKASEEARKALLRP